MFLRQSVYKSSALMLQKRIQIVPRRQLMALPQIKFLTVLCVFQIVYLDIILQLIKEKVLLKYFESER